MEPTDVTIEILKDIRQEMRDEFRASTELRPRVERCEQDIANIKRRLPES